MNARKKNVSGRQGKMSPKRQATLVKQFSDPERAVHHLSAALGKGQPVFLPALKDVAVARGGMGPLGKKTKLNREGLYKLLSSRGNPRLSSLIGILGALG